MKKTFSKILIGLVLLVISLVVLSFVYYLPSTHMAELVGTEVKRMNESGGTTGRTRDVRYIVARDKSSGKTLMFRNEDMGWPPHFKFNSGSLSGQVMNLKESHPDATVLITYYGWRIPFFSAYPNVTAIKVVDDDYRHIPWGNFVFLASLLFIVLFSFFKTRKIFRQRFRRKKVDSLADDRRL